MPFTFSRLDINVNQLNLNLISAKIKHLDFLKQEVKYKKIAEQLSDKLLQSKISAFNNKIIDTVCFELPNAFWHRETIYIYISKPPLMYNGLMCIYISSNSGIN
jgi:hypothetical protein